MIDTHAHIYSEEFDQDREEVIKRAVGAGVEQIILANVDAGSLEPLLKIWKQHPDVCIPTIGLHPTSVEADFEEQLSILEKEIDRYPFCAIGEIGIDLYWDKTYREQQLVAFGRQLQWAHERDLPVIIHVRDAFEDLHRTLETHKHLNLRGIIHSFSGTAEDVEKIRENGDFLFGINGIATFKKSHLPDVIRTIGADHLVVETDAPYLAPVPYRGKRNEPAYVIETAKKIAEILDMDYDAINQITTENAKRLFKTVF
ncbi:MAG: TatD family hydrolase [Bacteroidales bacterium]